MGEEARHEMLSVAETRCILFISDSVNVNNGHSLLIF